MPGDRWQQFANLRALYGHMWAHPGKKLLFMGGELAQEQEWSHERSLDWHLLERADHGGVQALVRDLNRIYRDEPALWEADYEPTGFRWLEADDASWNVLAFARFSGDGSRCLVSAGNFSPVPRHRYRIGLPRGGRWREVLNTDAAGYGGSNVVNGTVVGRGDALARPALLGRGDAPAARRPLARARKLKPGRVLASSYKRLSGTLERHDPLMARNHDSGRN